MSAVRIRRAGPDDGPAVASLMDLLEAVAHGTVAPGLKARFMQLLALDHHRVWVAGDEGGVLGLVTASMRPTLYHSGRSVLIDKLVVDPKARGGGVVRRLIETVVHGHCSTEPPR